jgi:hypothetical protein
MPSLATKLTTAPIILAVLVGALGCGGNGSGSSSRSTKSQTRQLAATQPLPAALPPPSHKKPQPKPLYIRRANAICRALIPKAEQLRRRYLFKPALGVRQQGFSKLAREVRSALQNIRGLRPPRGGQQQVRRIYAAASVGATQLEQASREPALAKKILSGTDPFAQTSALARAYGLTSCQETAGITTPR